MLYCRDMEKLRFIQVSLLMDGYGEMTDKTRCERQETVGLGATRSYSRGPTWVPVQQAGKDGQVSVQMAKMQDVSSNRADEACTA